eukprot:COSAG06_NODE_280_length_18452_cov_26.989660_12_plen_164_part_00
MADVSAIVAIGMQDKYVTVLGERVALWHQGVNDANMARVDDAIAAIKRLERRLTGVKQPGTGPEEDLIKHLMSQYRADMRDVFAADEVVRTTRQKETGMKVARSTVPRYLAGAVGPCRDNLRAGALQCPQVPVPGGTGGAARGRSAPATVAGTAIDRGTRTSC